MVKIIEHPGFDRTGDLVERLAQLWEASVRATHRFLGESDIVGMRDEVRAGIAGIPLLAVAYEGEVPRAFAGAHDGILEMLFVAPEARGHGIGRAMLARATCAWDVFRLDCNAQNDQARGFYEHEGFEVLYRTSLDDAGRPFPLLRMHRACGVRAEMRSGEWFDASDAQLAEDRERAKAEIRRFNCDLGLLPWDRAGILRGLFGSFGQNTQVESGLWADYGYHVFLGDNVFVNCNAVFLDGAPIVLEDGVMAGPNCTFATPLHPLLAEERATWRERNLPIRVCKGAWLASNVTVNPGVTIGEGAVIGSGSVVTRDIPAGMLAFGNPCRPVRPLAEADRVL